MLNEHRHAGGSAPEFGAVKPRCSGLALVTQVSLSQSRTPRPVSVGVESTGPGHAWLWPTRRTVFTCSYEGCGLFSPSGVRQQPPWQVSALRRGHAWDRHKRGFSLSWVA